MERYYTIPQLEERTGISRRTIYGAIKRGEIQTFMPNGLNRGWRIAEGEFRRWLESKTRRA